MYIAAKALKFISLPTKIDIKKGAKIVSDEEDKELAEMGIEDYANMLNELEAV